MAILVLLAVVIVCSGSVVESSNIDLAECEPPDYPQSGGYGPRQPFYVAGDIIHYYCDTDAYIGGNYLRKCEDTGDWTGEAPVCDLPASFSTVNQTSTNNPSDMNSADKATDSLRGTCSSTAEGQGGSWMGLFADPGELIRVMVFLPRDYVSYEVFLMKRNGVELSCGRKEGHIGALNWEFHNCPGPNNRDAIGVMIKSLSARRLELCEVVAHVLSPPTCVDPHVRIENGCLEISRKTANLVCNSGYTKSPETSLECVRTGVWNRKRLYCSEGRWELDSRG